MNTHDIDIELPPLPPLHIVPSVEPVDYPEVAQVLLDYARAAIEADRKRNDNWRHAVMCAISHNDYETDAPRRVQQALRLLSDAFHGLPFRESIIDDLIADRQRRGEPVACFKCGHTKHGGECVNVAPQSAEPDYKQLFEQMCERCDYLDAKLAEYSEREPVAWRYKTSTGWHATTDAAKALRVADHRAIEPLYSAPQPADTVVKESLTAPDGWQLVPKEPTEEMLINAMEASLLGRPSPDDDSYVRSIVAAWCEAAPKFGEEE